MSEELKDVSEWSIFIDDVEGELAMDWRAGIGGRYIDVLAREEVVPVLARQAERIREMEDRNRKLERLVQEIDRTEGDALRAQIKSLTESRDSWKGTAEKYLADLKAERIKANQWKPPGAAGELVDCLAEQVRVAKEAIDLARAQLVYTQDLFKAEKLDNSVAIYLIDLNLARLGELAQKGAR